MMGSADVPKVLKNLICEFAYGVDLETVQKDVDTCLEIKKMDLHPLFLRDLVWSRSTWSCEITPLCVFQPISAFGNTWEDVFEWQVVQEMLWRLDFRRKHVRCLFRRQEWISCFCKDWRSIKAFSDFFCFLLYTRIPCFKPIWKAVGFNHLRNFGPGFAHIRTFDLLVR